MPLEASFDVPGVGLKKRATELNFQATKDAAQADGGNFDDALTYCRYGLHRPPSTKLALEDLRQSAGC